ncbi:hypothetical protein NDU88_004679 [Pleurodeles waltl]|uniref:Secreted protein n=1 Tax=Pleurodeles waltl TaxID=8319 RepID=A0AAV7W8K0_PLEWA|nr:hypothetical protein NDU88_004679 [Pleurodeles waltl]
MRTPVARLRHRTLVVGVLTTPPPHPTVISTTDHDGLLSRDRASGCHHGVRCSPCALPSRRLLQSSAHSTLSPPLQRALGPVCWDRGGSGRQDYGGFLARCREHSSSAAGRPSYRPRHPRVQQ